MGYGFTDSGVQRYEAEDIARNAADDVKRDLSREIDSLSRELEDVRRELEQEREQRRRDVGDLQDAITSAASGRPTRTF